MTIKSGFDNIIEELTWEFAKMSGGNPYILQDLTVQRNVTREKEQNASKGKKFVGKELE